MPTSYKLRLQVFLAFGLKMLLTPVLPYSGREAASKGILSTWPLPVLANIKEREGRCIGGIPIAHGCSVHSDLDSDMYSHIFRVKLACAVCAQKSQDHEIMMGQKHYYSHLESDLQKKLSRTWAPKSKRVTSRNLLNYLCAQCQLSAQVFWQKPT